MCDWGLNTRRLEKGKEISEQRKRMKEEEKWKVFVRKRLL